MQIDITLEQALQRATAPLRRKMQHSVELLRKAERLAMHYNPLNIIIQQGTAYCLASEPKKKENGALYSPCNLCALRYDCISDGGTEPLRSLCQLHQATDQEYYREVGRAQYATAFGTIEVVDEMKELELEKKRLEEEDDE